MKYLFPISLSLLALALLVRLFLLLQYGPTVSDGQELSYTTTILSEPQQQGNVVKFTTSYSNMFGSIPISVSVANGTDVQYGDSVRISGKVNSRLLANLKTANSISFAKIEANRNDSKNALAIASFIRQKVINFYEKNLPSVPAALMTGIVLGVKETFPKDFQTALQVTGLMHIIAASGMNVTLVSGFLISIFGKFFSRRITIFTSAFGLFMYCILAGLQPSIVRATIMCFLALAGQLFGRQYTGWYALVVTGGVMLLVSPSLLFDIGFQLSFAATAGILFIRPIIPKVFFMSDDIATTVAAQLTTIPILLVSFGQYGVLSILVNAMVLWMVPLLMILGGVGAIVGLVIPFLGTLLVWMSYPLLILFQNIVLLFGKSGAVLTLSDVPLPIILGYYILLISGILFIKARRQ